MKFWTFSAIGSDYFWLRRNVIRIKRFWHSDLKTWPKLDANLILYFEMIIMCLFLTMNAADLQLQLQGASHYTANGGIMGSFPLSQFIAPLFENMSISSLIILERTAWWLHITGILFFLNYLYYSKHLHILLAFPNTYFGRVRPQGQFDNLQSVTDEVKLMMDPDADPYATLEEDEDTAVPEKFGASDATDLNWVQLLSAYTCTECGRCTSECPANQTGKNFRPGRS